MSDDWYNGLDLGKLVGLVFIDLKKAFDTVDHDILCKKLDVYGVQQRELSWFRSYLYADDTSLCYQSHDLTQLNEDINSDLKKLVT